MAAQEHSAGSALGMRAIPPGFENAHADTAKYRAMYNESIADPDKFWGREGKRLDWITPYTKVKNTDFTYGHVSIKWYEDGVLSGLTGSPPTPR